MCLELLIEASICDDVSLTSAGRAFQAGGGEVMDKTLSARS